MEKIKKGSYPMEELQIQTFVHRASTDPELRDELRREPDDAIMREGFSPRVSRILARLAPQLALDQKPLDTSFGWWGY
jgi:hypothetical protein